jgi:alpha-ketoglutarate-dependent taurine dioxygenase
MTIADHEPVSVMRYETEFDTDKFTQMLDHHGYVYLHDVPDGFDHVRFLAQFGPLMPQYDGAMIWSIKAETRFDNLYHSLNTKPLKPHTECYEFDGVPPKYLALWCLVPASDGGGHTTLADMHAFLDALTVDERHQLATRNYRFVSSSGVQDMALGRTAVHPIWENRAGVESIVRYSYNCVVHNDDPFLLDIRERVLRFFEAAHIAVDFEPNALLIWNNHWMTHSRTGYTDRRRHLRRVWLAEQPTSVGAAT